jgi:hypothetical protein
MRLNQVNNFVADCSKIYCELDVNSKKKQNKIYKFFIVPRLLLHFYNFE